MFTDVEIVQIILALQKVKESNSLFIEDLQQKVVRQFQPLMKAKIIAQISKLEISRTQLAFNNQDEVMEKFINETINLLKELS